MPYQKVEPISEAIMLKKRYHGHNTICQILREIYVLSDSAQIKMKSRIAMTMAKKMHEKLREYKEKEMT